jgi:hypothetical protein
MKAETKLKRILLIENDLRKEHQLFKFIMTVIPQSPIQLEARNHYNELRYKLK